MGNDVGPELDGIVDAEAGMDAGVDVAAESRTTTVATADEVVTFVATVEDGAPVPPDASFF